MKVHVISDVINDLSFEALVKFYSTLETCVDAAGNCVIEPTLVYIDSVGGDAHLISPIIRLLETHQSRLHLIYGASAAVDIFCFARCPKEVGFACEVMIHKAETRLPYPTNGRNKDTVKAIKASYKDLEAFRGAYYLPLMTPAQSSAYKKGNDVVFTPTEFRTFLDKANDVEFQHSFTYGNDEATAPDTGDCSDVGGEIPEAI